MSNRVYSEEEVAKLIRRAVEMDSNQAGSSRKSDQKGLTLQDLEKIAADSGIDPELIHQAADEYERNSALENLKETTRINRSEIVAEHWIKGQLTERMIDDLILELNHRFGTSEDDINWWDKLWNDYSGKPLIKRTSTSADWRYTDEIELYTTRVLLQQRGDKIRIRVGKRQGWNLSWNADGSHLFLASSSLVLFTVIGGVLGFTLLDSPLMGILGGASLAALLVPITVFFGNRLLKRHVEEVSEIAEVLVLQAKQLSKVSEPNRKKEKGHSSSDNSSFRAIEIESNDKESSYSGESGLKNHLREK